MTVNKELCQMIHEDAHLVAEATDTVHLLDQMIEEASELIQATSKLRRAYGYGTTTPVTVEQAIGMLIEEIGDILVVLTVLRFKEDNIFNKNSELLAGMAYKTHRWASRIGGVEG